MSDASPVPDPAAAPPLRWGILAPGGIANKFAEAVRDFTAGRVVAVTSRDAERAAEFARRHGIPRAYAGYEQLCADPEVDAVYVASPHSHHRDHAVLMAAAGKHLLIEKALARNEIEVDEIFAAAGAAGVFAMEAMWTRHLPHIAVIRRWLAAGRIGEVVTVSADHGQSLDLGPGHRLKNPDLAGGALLDLGVYPVAFVLDLLGEPEQVVAVGHLTETGVDATVAVTLRYRDPMLGLAGCTLKVKTPTTAVICGTSGRIELDGDFYGPTVARLLGPGKRPEVLAEFDGRVPNGFQFEIAEVARCVAVGLTESDRMSWAGSRAVIRVLDSARRQVGVRYPGEG